MPAMETSAGGVDERATAEGFFFPATVEGDGGRTLLLALALFEALVRGALVGA